MSPKTTYDNDIEMLFKHLENKDVTGYMPFMYIYDKRGGELYEELIKHENYYIYHSDLEVAEINARALSKKVGLNVLFFEYGSGNCRKSKPFLRHLEDLTGFVALDIDRHILEKAKKDINFEFPNVDMHVIADDFFTESFNLPRKYDDHKMKIFYMAGGTINIFERDEAFKFFKHISKLMKSGDLCIISIDPMRDIQKTHRLYDSIYYQSYIKNILHRLNKYLIN